MKRLIIISIACILGFSACGWQQPDEGTVEVKTVYGEAVDVIMPNQGGVWRDWYGLHWRDDYYTVNIKAKTETYQVQASSKDNAGLVLPVTVTYSIPMDKANVIAYVQKFGLTDEERETRRVAIVKSRVEDITRKNTALFDAYQLLISQQGIQNEALKDLKEIFSTQLHATLESVVVDKPDFVDDNIELAGSRVVAAKKKQEEEDALKKAAETRIERLKIEAQTFENPKMYALELKKLEKEIAEAWAKHNGTLVFGDTKSLIGVK